MLYLSLVVVLFATSTALITDLKERMIYRHLTIPVFICGILYSLYSLLPYFNYVSLSKTGITILWYIIQAWLGPILFVFIYSLLLFWLGVLDGGDGQFLIAITPWLGVQQMVKVILYFYPVAILYLAVYLLYQNNFNYKKVALQQYSDLTLVFSTIPRILTNIRGGAEHVLVNNISYQSQLAIPPAGMVPISIVIFISLVT